MTLQYNYTGLYAAEVNWMDGTTPTSDYFSNIPNSAMIAPTTRTLSITNDDTPNNAQITLQLGSYSTGAILSVNVLVYYDIYVEDIEKTVTKALVWTVEGNVNQAIITGTLELNSYEPINAMGTNKISNQPPQY